MSPDDRRPFRGPAFDRGRPDRPHSPGMDRDRPADRGGFPPPRPFVRPPTRGGDMPPPDHSVHLRDGDREIRVSGNPAFVRQVLDDLPALMARLHGEGGARTSISMPAPPSATEPSPSPTLIGTLAPEAPAATAPTNGAPALETGSLEGRVIEVLRASSRPLSIAAIRQRLDDDVTGQQVRRLLERAGSRVVVSEERPATYTIT